MLEAIKGIVGSKKFWITVIGSAVVTGLSLAHVSQDIVMVVAGLFGVNVGAQGYADGSKK